MRNWLFILLFVFSVKASATMIIPTRDPFLPTAVIVPVHISTPSAIVHTCWIPLYFSNATHVMAFLSKKSLHVLSLQGQMNADENSNQIWVQDDNAHIAAIRELIQHLDKPGPQFIIKAKIINLDRDYEKALGFLFQTETKSKSSLMGLNMDQHDPGESPGEFTLTIAKLAENHLLDMQISALEQDGHASLISSPSLTTLNNQPAVIESGAEVPYQEVTLSGGTSVSFKKAVLRLKVTPQLMPQRHILLHIELNQDKVSALTVKGVPAIQTQQITTQVIVKNNQTIVLGGILETTKAHQTEGMPGLDKIPLLGKLFQHQTELRKQQVLLIFITPSMMKAM